MNSNTYAYVLGLYLGDGTLAIDRKGVYRLEISCANVWPGLITEAAGALDRLLPGKRAGQRQAPGCVIVSMYWKHWPCLFPQHRPGRKHERPIALEAWQQAIVDAYTGDFLRGLFHSDGCRVMNRVRHMLRDGERWYAYPRYFFSNESQPDLGHPSAHLG